MKKIFPNKTKFYRYSDLLNYVRGADEEIIKILNDFSDSRYISKYNLSEILKFSLFPVQGEQYVGLEIKDKFFYIDQIGVSLNEPKVINNTFLYDDKNPITAKSSAPLTLDLIGLGENFPGYAKKNFGVVYVSGSPQRLENYNFLLTADNKYQLYFNKVSFGAFFPTPKDKYNKLNDKVINGIPAALLNDFCDDGVCKFEFKFLNLLNTQRPLVLEKVSGTQRIYYLLSRGFPLYSHGLFYEVSEDNLDEIVVHLENLTFDSNDVIFIYFLSEAYPRSFTENSRLAIFDLLLRPQDIREETLSTIKLFVEDGSGFLRELNDLSAEIGSLSYNLDLNSSVLKIDKVILAGRNKVFYKDVVLNPEFNPVRVFDFVDNITIFTNLGTKTKVSNGRSYDLLIKNKEVISSAISINSVNGEKLFTKNATEVVADFKIGADNGDYEYVGRVYVEFTDVYADIASKFYTKVNEQNKTASTLGRHFFFFLSNIRDLLNQENADFTQILRLLDFLENIEKVRVFWVFLSLEDISKKVVIENIKKLNERISKFSGMQMGIFILNRIPVNIEFLQEFMTSPTKFKNIIEGISAIFAYGPLDKKQLVKNGANISEIDYEAVKNFILALRDVSIQKNNTFALYTNSLLEIDLAQAIFDYNILQSNYKKILFTRGGNIFTYLINGVPVNLLSLLESQLEIVLIEDAFSYNTICSSENSDFCKLFATEQFLNHGLSVGFVNDYPTDVRSYKNYLYSIINSPFEIGFTLNSSSPSTQDKNAYTLFFNEQTQTMSVNSHKNKIINFKKLFRLSSGYKSSRFNYFYELQPLEEKTLYIPILDKENIKFSFGFETKLIEISVLVNGYAGVRSTYTELFKIIYEPTNERSIIYYFDNTTDIVPSANNNFEFVSVSLTQYGPSLEIMFEFISNNFSRSKQFSINTNSLLITYKNFSNLGSVHVGSVATF